MAGIDTSSLMNCSYGAAGFMLDQLSVTQQPQVIEGQGIFTTHITYTGEGFVDDTIPANFFSKVTAIQTAMSLAAQPFTVSAGGSTMFMLEPGACLDGGPFCEFKINDGDNPLHKRITFTLKARLAAPVGSTFEANLSILPDGRMIYKQRGQFSGAGAITVMGTIIGTLAATYGSPNWIARWNYKNNSNGTRCDYEFSAEQCSNPLPGGGARAVDGEATSRFTVDSQHKKTTITDCDFLIVGDPVAFHNSLRGQFDPATIFAESYSATSIHGVRVHSSFTVVTGADGDDLILWEQTVTMAADQPVYEEKTFVGAMPVAVLKPTTLGRITQHGRAIGSGAWPQPPTPIPTVPTKITEVTYSDDDWIQKTTSWNYEGLAVNSDGTPVSFTPGTPQRPPEGDSQMY